jgi:nitroreductase
MELREAIHHRRTIRAFLPDPVPEDSIREIISEALWAPSWKNAQPWELVVAHGEILERFKKENRETLLSGNTSMPEIPLPKSLPSPFHNRYADLNRQIYETISIEEDNTRGHIEYYAQMYALYDAPALVLMLLDKGLAIEYAMLDCGLFLQTFCLLARERSLGTAILSAAVHCPDVVRRIFPIPENKLLVVGVALGWPDTDSALNSFARNRRPINEFVKWIN